MASKGKAVMSTEKGSSPNKKRGVKRKNRDVLQFFEDAALDSDGFGDTDDSGNFFDDDEFLDFSEDPKEGFAPQKVDQVPFFPKEEELSGDELEKLVEKRYMSGTGSVRYADDNIESKRSVVTSFLIPSVGEPIIWKVKCKVGREKNVVFCLIQKYVDLKVLETKLKIISAFFVEHIKGFVFVEAEKQADVAEACNQLADVYATLVTRVPTNEFGQLLNVRKRHNEVKIGTWARVKNGIYRGDLAQVVAVNNERKRATVKLIPRIDLQALTDKYGGAANFKRAKSAIPAARLISPRDLEEFRPLMQYRRDRDVGQVFEFLDGLMLKDGFLFKKVSIDSLAFWDVKPSEDELLKFSLPSRDDSDNLEWLSQLYGEQKKKCNVKINKGGGKGEGSSGSNEQSNFEVHDLVLFGKRDFGMVIGLEKDESYKIIKHGSEGPVTLTLGQKELKYVSLDNKFTALDHRLKTISINDTVRVLDGPDKGKQGLVKQIYRGILFLFDENDMDNAYFCTKSLMSERVKHPDSACLGKDEGCLSTFDDLPSSPKSPLSPKKPWQMRENSDDPRDKSEMFSVGQALRIKVGPLKGYLCRVIAVRYSDVTVKLDSKQKVLTVKREHLSEVRDKSSAQSISDDYGLSSSFKPFDLLGAEGCGNDWLQGASESVENNGWNVGPSNDRSSLPAASSWGSSIQVGAATTSLPASVDNDSGKGDDSWLKKVPSNQNLSCEGDTAVKVWGTTDSGWGKNSGASSSWEKAKISDGDPGGCWNNSIPDSGQGCGDSMVKAWEQGSKVSKATSSWSNQSTDKGNAGACNKVKDPEGAGGWDNLCSSGDVGPTGWGNQTPCDKSASVGESVGKPCSVSWAKGIVSDVNDQWANAKDSGTKISTEDPWATVVDTWGNKDSSSKSKVWRTASVSAVGEEKGQDHGSGSWGKSHDKNSAGGWATAGGWKSEGDSGQDKTSGWTKRSFGDDSGGNVSWGNGGRGAGGRRGHGRDQFGRGRGRGRSFDDGPFSNNSKDSQDNYSSGNKGWNKNDGWENCSASPVGGDKGLDHGSGGWAKPQDESSAGGWGAAGCWKSQGDSGQDNATSWKRQSFGDGSGVSDSWGKSKSFENDQGFSGGPGTGGRRGCGRDQFGRGRGRGRSFGDGQNDYSSGSKGWNKNEGGPSWGNSSTGNGQSSWGKEKGWNGESKHKVWNHSSELEKNASSTVWNGASSGSSSWGQASWGKGNDLAADGTSWVRSTGSRSESSAMDVDLNSSNDSWGKAASNQRKKSQEWGSTQLGQSSEAFASDSSNKGGNPDSSGWKKDGGGWQGKCWGKGPDNKGEGSWSKAGNSSWERPGNLDNDQGFGSGRGYGRRGRGRGFGRGLDHGGRDGGGSGGRGQFSGWKGEGEGGSSWANSSAKIGGNSWSKGWNSGGAGEDKSNTGGEGGSNWGSGSDNPRGGWGNSGGWNQKGQDNVTNDASGNKNWNAGQGSWGNSGSGGNMAVGGSSWGNSLPDKGKNEPGEGGSGWGGKSNAHAGWADAAEGSDWKAQDNPKGSWENPGGWNQKGQDNVTSNSSGNKSWNAGKSIESGGNMVVGGSSWGNSLPDKGKNEPGEGGSDKKAQENRGNESSENKTWNMSQGGSSWGNSQSSESPWRNAGSSGNKAKDNTGNESFGNKSWNAGEGGGSAWGNPQSSRNSSGGGGWGS